MVALAALIVGCAASTPVELNLTSGAVRGALQKSGVRSFFGVPFAQPPVGDKRWQPPEQEQPWAGVRQATAYTKGCMQSKNGMAPLGEMSSPSHAAH